MSVIRASLFRLATSARFERTVRAAPSGERQAWRAASRYVAGTTMTEAWQVANRLHDRRIGASIDQFGELVTDATTAGVAVSRPVPSRAGCRPQSLRRPSAPSSPRLPPGRRIQVGAEDHDRAYAVLDCVLAVAALGNGLADRLGATVQANLHRSGDDLDRLVRPACTSGWSRAPTSSRPIERCPTASPPTSPIGAWATDWRRPTRTSRWPLTTAFCAPIGSGTGCAGSRSPVARPDRGVRRTSCCALCT